MAVKNKQRAPFSLFTSFHFFLLLNGKNWKLKSVNHSISINSLVPILGSFHTSHIFGHGKRPTGCDDRYLSRTFSITSNQEIADDGAQTRVDGKVKALKRPISLFEASSSGIALKVLITLFSHSGTNLKYWHTFLAKLHGRKAPTQCRTCQTCSERFER